MAWVWFNSISSQARINVLLIEPLLHQIKVLADGLACSLPSAMKGIISIHYFTLYNIPIINELQLWSPTRSIMAAPAGCINHRQKQVCGSSTRDKLIIRFTMINCYVWTDRTGSSMNMLPDAQYSWSYKDQSEEDVNISEEKIKAECQYVVFSIYSDGGCPVYGI